MAKGIIGDPFTFTVLFVDAGGDPIVPSSVTIEVFYFDSLGVKQTLAASGTVMSAVGGDVGRYAYTITIPGALTPADQIYGVMTGVDPVSGTDIVVEQEVDPFNEGSGELEIWKSLMWVVWLPFTSHHSPHLHTAATGILQMGIMATKLSLKASPEPPPTYPPRTGAKAHPLRQGVGQIPIKQPPYKKTSPSLLREIPPDLEETLLP